MTKKPDEMITATIISECKDPIPVKIDKDGSILLNGLTGLDQLVESTNATYAISYATHKEGSITFPDGTTKDWRFLPR